MGVLLEARGADEEVASLLVAPRGWSSDDYERWLAQSLAAEPLVPSPS
jgi:hypothetical protein